VNVERFELNDIVPQPWKNGAGLTREIARDGQDDTFDWRFSLAQVDRNAPFSAFHGMNRCIVLMRGSGMRLRAEDGSIDHHLASPLVPFQFPGDVALTATLVDGPSSDFNVMTRRGAFRSEVACHRVQADLQRADIVMLVCSTGRWLVHCDGRHELTCMQALLLRAPQLPLLIEPLAPTPNPALLSVRLWREQSI
jgi:uncharacterized protein